VLLQGETGTGTGLVAQVLQASGARAHGPFVAVNGWLLLPALDATLLAMFGLPVAHEDHVQRAVLAALRLQVVGIIGEPGLGKARLMTEFRRSLHGRQLTYLTGHCLAYRQATPYGPVQELLQQACPLTAADSPATMARKVRQRLVAVGVAPEDGVPYVGRAAHRLGSSASSPRSGRYHRRR
jgi:hypothetical protein